MKRSRAITPDALEARLATRFGRKPSSGHRDRVLTAVQDVLRNSGTIRRHAAGTTTSGTAALAAMALSAAVAIVMPWLVFAEARGLPATESVAALRARAAAIDTPLELALAKDHAPRGLPSDTRMRPLGQRHEAWRIRQDLSGEL